jgi:hypothetical protein
LFVTADPTFASVDLTSRIAISSILQLDAITREETKMSLPDDLLQAQEELVHHLQKREGVTTLSSQEIIDGGRTVETDVAKITEQMRNAAISRATVIPDAVELENIDEIRSQEITKAEDNAIKEKESYEAEVLAAEDLATISRPCIDPAFESMSNSKCPYCHFMIPPKLAQCKKVQTQHDRR